VHRFSTIFTYSSSDFHIDRIFEFIDLSEDYFGDSQGPLPTSHRVAVILQQMSVDTTLSNSSKVSTQPLTLDLICFPLALEIEPAW
jgi:hypothetical protein